jgi:ComEC/Rec2-related protein
MGWRTFRRTTRFIVCCTAIIAGLAWARWGNAISGWWPVLFGLFALLSFRKARILSVYTVILFGFTLGWFRGSQFISEVRYFDKINKKSVTIVGTALQDSTYNERAAVSFELGSLQLESPDTRKLVGKIGVSGFGERMIYRGDTVRVTGKFYPARGSLIARLSFAKLEVVSRSQSVAYEVTREFGAGMLSALPEPQASFGLGLLIGQRNSLPKSTSDILAAVGLTHIIAVSGYNLTILVRATRRILAKRSKFQAMVGALALIFGFLLVTGASPSIVRASIISVLALGAWYYGRVIRPMFLIMLTAAGTALWNPLYLWSDIGWYLSFLAFYGVLILAPLARQRLFKGKMRGVLTEVLLESTAAQIMTLPLILYIFNESSFIALFANLLVVPLIPIAMLLSFVAGIGGMLIPELVGWIAWPARWLLTYLLDVATLVARIPHMRFSIELSALAMTLCYISIGGIALLWWHKIHKSSKITDVKGSNVVV